MLMIIISAIISRGIRNIMTGQNCPDALKICYCWHIYLWTEVGSTSNKFSIILPFGEVIETQFEGS